MKRDYSTEKGFTLIEVIITIALMSIVIQIVYAIFFVGIKSYDTGKNMGFAQQEVRLAADIINSELRYINDLKTTPLVGKYYSLEIKNNGDETFYLEKKQYDEMNPEGKIVRIINGKYSKISLDNSITSGVINATLEQFEEENKYNINFEVTLENNRTLSWYIPISSDDVNTVFYYSFPENALTTSETNPETVTETVQDIIPIGITYLKKSELTSPQEKEKTYIVDITVKFSDSSLFTHEGISVVFKRNKKDNPYPEFVIATVNGVSASGFKYTKDIKIYN